MKEERKGIPKILNIFFKEITIEKLDKRNCYKSLRHVFCKERGSGRYPWNKLEALCIHNSHIFGLVFAWDDRAPYLSALRLHVSLNVHFDMIFCFYPAKLRSVGHVNKLFTAYWGECNIMLVFLGWLLILQGSQAHFILDQF